MGSFLPSLRQIHRNLCFDFNLVSKVWCWIQASSLKTQFRSWKLHQLVVHQRYMRHPLDTHATSRTLVLRSTCRRLFNNLFSIHIYKEYNRYLTTYTFVKQYLTVVKYNEEFLCSNKKRPNSLQVFPSTKRYCTYFI